MPPAVLAALLLLLPSPHLSGESSPAQGRQIVHASCETCHSLSAGQLRIGPSLYGELNTSHPRATPEQVIAIIRDGKAKMPAYRDLFSAAQIDSIVAYLGQLP